MTIKEKIQTATTREQQEIITILTKELDTMDVHSQEGE